MGTLRHTRESVSCLKWACGRWLGPKCAVWFNSWHVFVSSVRSAILDWPHLSQKLWETWWRGWIFIDFTLKTVGFFLMYFFLHKYWLKVFYFCFASSNFLSGLFSPGQEQQAHPHHDLEPPRPLDRWGRGLHRLHPPDSVCWRAGSAEIQPVGGDACVAAQRQQVAEHPLPLLRRTSRAAAVRYPSAVFR